MLDAVFTGARANRHQRFARIGQNRFDVGKVDIDHTGFGDEVSHALDALAQHTVDNLEALQNRNPPLGVGFNQTIVGDHHQCIDIFAQLFEATLGLLQAFVTLKFEGFGDDSDGQNP